MVSVISGYFQAASFGVDSHPGYVDYFTSAAKDADMLIVIIQSVTQQYKKYGPLARPLHTIIQNIIEWCKLHLRCRVIVVINHQENIANTLRYLATKYDDLVLRKDGDRKYGTLPKEEKDVLSKYNIKFEFLGNAKKASSTEILTNYKEETNK